MRYRDELPLVLKNLNLSIKANEKVSLVGRTGSGKSSIAQALLRISEPTENSTYEINGFKALEMGLHSLRHNISVIPQTPFFFRGTISQNLDPLRSKSEK